MALLPSDPNRYEFGSCIGRGSYGDVFKGIDTVSGKEVAFKIIDLEEVEDDIEGIHKEITMLAGCQCKNITEFYAAVVQPGTTELIIVMELMACSVADLLAHGPLDEESIAHILHEVLEALVYLHSEKRIHRDVKAANVLLNGAGDVKISDFGVSGQLTGTMGFSRKTFVGTPFWMAPEVIDSEATGGGGYKETADVWSLGITAIEMATCTPPHAELHPMRVLFLIPKSQPPQLDGDFSADFKDFVSKCLQKDPSARPSARELLSHPFVVNATTPPATLGGMAEELAKRRQPIKSRRDMAQDWAASGGTLPGWDFGTRKFAGRMTMKMGDTLKAGAAGAAAVNNRMDAVASIVGTVSSRPDSKTNPRQTASVGGDDGTNGTGIGQTAAAAAAAAAAGGVAAGLALLSGASSGGLGGTVRTASQGGGVLAAGPRPPGWTDSDPDGRGGVVQLSGSGGGAKATVGPAALRYAQAQQQGASSESTSEDSMATVVRVNEGADKYGTVQSKVVVPPSDSAFLTPRGSSSNTNMDAAAIRATTSTAGAVSGDGASELVTALSLRRTNTLQVEISNPATASPDFHLQQQTQPQQPSSLALPPQPQQQSALKQRGSATKSQQGQAMTESAAALAHVIVPALDTMSATLAQQPQAHIPQVAGAPTQLQALAGLKNHIQQIEKQFPGTCALLVQELLSHLAATTHTALAPIQTAASVLLARPTDTPTAATTSGGDYQAALAAATNVSASKSRVPSSNSLSAAASVQGAGATVTANGIQTGSAGGAAGKGGPGGAGAPGATVGPGFLPQRQVPAMGALGEFLLGKWQLEEARGRSLLARTGALG